MNWHEENAKLYGMKCKAHNTLIFKNYTPCSTYHMNSLDHMKKGQMKLHGKTADKATSVCYVYIIKRKHQSNHLVKTGQ